MGAKNLGVDSLTNFEPTLWGDIHFLISKMVYGAEEFGHFRDFNIGKVALSRRENEHNFWTKIASTFVKVSIESSEFRAFDRDLNEGASYFRFQRRLEILKDLSNPWNSPILTVLKMPTVPRKIAGFWKILFYYQNRQWSSQPTMYYIGRFVGLLKTGVFGRQDPKITSFSQFRHFLT